ncbi:MAG: MmgE/PrpD family protein, partial [Pseudomonadota bacterium]
MTLTQSLIELIRNKPIDNSDREAAAMFTLDSVATAYAGSATPTGAILLQWARESDLDLKRKAMLLGALMHITETDDLHRASVTHPACVVIPVALVLGEHLGASGARVLDAILHGYEAICRVGAAVGPEHYRIWHNTATCGPFGSAMAAAALLELDDEQTLHALGNAGTQSSGFWEFMTTGAMSKHLHAGHAAETGWLAAEMAKFGFTGSPAILEGEKAMFAGMCPDPKPSEVLANATAPWQLHASSIKPWPSCRHTHPAIDCALELASQLQGDDIQSVTLRTYQAALDVCDRPQPDSEYQAKFSLYHCIAVALLDGRVGLDSFDEGARKRTADLRAKITAQASDPFASSYPVAWGSGIEVTTGSGAVLSTERTHCKGDPELALDETEMRTKAKGLLKFGGIDAASDPGLRGLCTTTKSSRLGQMRPSG